MRYISFSLWIGDPATAPKYLIGAVENVKLAKEIYPDWVCRFYVPHFDPFCEMELAKCTHRLMEMGAELAFPGFKTPISTGNSDGIPMMYHRFLVADSPNVEYFIVRDADSRLSLREKAAVDQWIESGKILSSLRDHPAHARGLNGGLWGAKGDVLPNMERSIRDWLAKLNRPFEYSDDQDFLGQVIWTKFHMHAMQHDSCCGYQGAVPFPTRREGYRFVGEVFEADGTPRAGDWEAIIPNS